MTARSCGNARHAATARTTLGVARTTSPTTPTAPRERAPSGNSNAARLKGCTRDPRAAPPRHPPPLVAATAVAAAVAAQGHRRPRGAARGRGPAGRPRPAQPRAGRSPPGGHADPDRHAAAPSLDPGDHAGHHAAAVYWRAFHLATKLDHLDHLAGPAAESVRRAPRPAEMHDHDHDDRRWE